MKTNYLFPLLILCQSAVLLQLLPYLLKYFKVTFLAIIFDSILSYCLANLFNFYDFTLPKFNLGNNHNVSKNVKINTENYKK